MQITIPNLTPSQHRAKYAELSALIGDRQPNWSGDFEAACALQALRTEAHLHYAASIGLGGPSDDIEPAPIAPAPRFDMLAMVSAVLTNSVRKP